MGAPPMGHQPGARPGGLPPGKPQDCEGPTTRKGPWPIKLPFIKLHAPLGMKTHFAGLAAIVCIA